MAVKRMTKSEFVTAVAKSSGLEKKQAVAALNAVNGVVAQQLKTKGEIVLPGLLKLVVVKKPAVPAHKGINPFTKQETMFKAKPARKVVKARPVKALKDAV
ncbi:MAG TPA: HU family DNA-binding protein [Anaerolineae bacterium]|nr:HU family DNA-binding protein [Anaerolineae bacterium]